MALAKSSCSEIFKNHSSANAFLYEENLLKEFTTAKVQLMESTTLPKANDALLSLVEISNHIFDQAIHYIIKVNFFKLAPEIKAQNIKVVEILIEELQLTFQIGNNAMTAAVKSRVEIELAELQAKSDALNVRRAIGFGRDQSSESFHSEVVDKQPIGFRPAKSQDISETEFVEKQTMGFIRRAESELDASIKEVVEYAEVRDGTEPQPIGFGPRTGILDGDVVEKSPIGFVHFKRPSEAITQAGLHKIFLDLIKGEFNFQKGDD